MTILKNEVLALTQNQDRYKDAEAYYEGDVPEVFASAKLRNVLRHSAGYRSTLNFCRPVVDAVVNRLEVSNVYGTTKAATDKIAEIMKNNELHLEMHDIHRRALEFGDCYAIVWPDEDGDIEISYNSPRSTVVVYDPERPRRKLYAVKMWNDSNNSTRMNVYYADRTDKWKVQNANPTEGSNWNFIESVDNPFGEIPVFHFRTHRPFGRPEHFDMYDAQDYINKEFIQSMVTIDYQGAPQRYAIAEAGANSEMEDFDDDDNSRENINALQNGPGEFWFFNGMKQVGEFKPADPEVFWKPIKDTVRACASLTNTPLHYFERTGNVPSGEALRAAEAPLIKKVRNRAESFGQTWVDIFNFALKIEQINATVVVEWAEVESIDESEHWDIMLKKRNVGLSGAQALREGGYSEPDIEKILGEAKEERAAGLVTGYERSTRVSTTNDETQEVTSE